MKYIEIPINLRNPVSGWFLGEVDREDELNYYVREDEHGWEWTIPKESVIPWDVSKRKPLDYKEIPNYKVDLRKQHLVKMNKL